MPIAVEVVNTPPSDKTEILLTIIASSIVAIIFGKIYEYYERWNKEKLNGKAMDLEIDNNLRIARTIVEQIDKPEVHHSVFNFAKFETIWLEKYITEFINFGNSDSERLHSYLYGSKKLMEQIQDTSNNQQLLNSSSRALASFKDISYNLNQTILSLAKELIPILENTKKLRKGNKISNNSRKIENKT